MTKLSKIIGNVVNDKNLKFNTEYYNHNNFISDAQEYIKAIKNRSMCCIIPHVSKSGMSRIIKLHSLYSNKGLYNYRNYTCFMQALGYTYAKDYYGFRIGGCGMDMIFATNYDIIHKLHRLGFINKAQCEILAQRTPTVL